MGVNSDKKFNLIVKFSIRVRGTDGLFDFVVINNVKSCTEFQRDHATITMCKAERLKVPTCSDQSLHNSR
jgi:hypothetical protein